MLGIMTNCDRCWLFVCFLLKRRCISNEKKNYNSCFPCLNQHLLTTNFFYHLYKNVNFFLLLFAIKRADVNAIFMLFGQWSRKITFCCCLKDALRLYTHEGTRTNENFTFIKKICCFLFSINLGSDSNANAQIDETNSVATNIMKILYFVIKITPRSSWYDL